MFIDLDTQWRHGMAGRTGIDYQAIPTLFALRQIPRARRAALFDDLRVMERAALDEIDKHRKRK